MELNDTILFHSLARIQTNERHCVRNNDMVEIEVGLNRYVDTCHLTLEERIEGTLTIEEWILLRNTEYTLKAHLRHLNFIRRTLTMRDSNLSLTSLETIVSWCLNRYALTIGILGDSKPISIALSLPLIERNVCLDNNLLLTTLLVECNHSLRRMRNLKFLTRKICVIVSCT